MATEQKEIMPGKSYNDPHKIKSMNFTNKAIKCDTWEQMEHLARIAEEQGYRPIMFRQHYFDEHGMVYFITWDNEYTNTYDTDDYTETTYTQFINQSDTPSVYGCYKTKQTMKHFKPIVIQKETAEFCKSQLERRNNGIIYVVFYSNNVERLKIPINNPTRLRDALNTILND